MSKSAVAAVDVQPVVTRSLNTPFAMAVSNAIGGVSRLTAFIVVPTSLVGAIVRV